MTAVMYASVGAVAAGILFIAGLWLYCRRQLSRRRSGY